MLVIVKNTPGGLQFRSVTLADLPPEPIPEEGRALTMHQINDALALVRNGLNGRPSKKDKDDSRTALHHLVGHIVATMPKDESILASRPTEEKK